MKTKKIILSIGTLFLAGILFIGLGGFNVSAQDNHWGITNSLLSLVKERSVSVRSGDLKVPPLNDQTMIANGAKNYNAMCAQCHLAPGMSETELNLGLYPKPPVFYKSKFSNSSHKEQFWIIKNGLKMTGMPAWGDFHTDQQMWEMVSFLSQIKGMSKQHYDELVGEGGHTHKEGAHEKQVMSSDSHNDSDEHHDIMPEKMMEKKIMTDDSHDNSDGHHDVKPKKIEVKKANTKSSHDNSDGHHH